MSYHNKIINKGILGQFSKIEEEFEELKDGYEQNHRILQICELCDLIGAVEAYAARWNLTLDDLIQMKNSTRKAFQTGSR